MKYVEDSGVVVYWEDRSLKLASKSEELLTGDETEGILAVINNNIIAKPNGLETEFAATVSKIQDISSESCFSMPKLQKNILNKKRIK